MDAVNETLLQMGQFRLRKHLADTESGAEMEYAEVEMTDLDIQVAMYIHTHALSRARVCVCARALSLSLHESVLACLLMAHIQLRS
jgi:hypothetical protein